MTRTHRADESHMITDLSKVSPPDSADVKVLAGWRGQGIRQGTSRTVLTDQRRREEDTAVIYVRFRSGLRVSSELTK